MLSGFVRVVPPPSITAIVNVGDDTVLHGLHISPDLDTITYTLAGMDNRETGWGVAGESWTVMEELARLGGESWFRLGDRDLATHLFRTERLQAGDSLSPRSPPPSRPAARSTSACSRSPTTPCAPC
jgi:LPPG:FO 2-phospho-L-lactate transferase